MKKSDPTSKQKQFIAMVGRKAFHGEDGYRLFLMDRYAVDSPTKMTRAECNDCIDVLKNIEQGKPIPPRNRSGLWASIDQVNKLRALQAMYGWDEAQLHGFIQRQTSKLKSIWMLTKGEATKTIIGLQKIIAKGNQENYNNLNAAHGRWLVKAAGISWIETEREANEA